MKPIVLAQEMMAMDRYAIEKIGIPGIVLMENAGCGISQVVMAMLGETNDKHVQILCGPGNNGGDGYVVARYLHNAGAHVEVFVVASREKIRGDALTNLNIWQNIGGHVAFLESVPEKPSQTPHVVIDALLGTGSSGKIEGLMSDAVTYINSLSAPILSVDIPTGVNADSGAVAGNAVRATATATLAMLKRGLLFSPGRNYAGKVQIIDIGMPPQITDTNDIQVWLFEAKDARKALPKRQSDAHKNQMGTVAILAGSCGLTGAATLTSMACLRAGCGLVYLCIPQSLQGIIASKVTEVITWPFEDRGTGYLLLADYPSWRDRLHSQDVIAIGPGLGQHPESIALVHTILKEMDKPLVLDADALNACTGHVDLIKNYRGDMILTPHPGELSRLINKPANEIVQNRVDIAQKVAQDWKKVLVLKGGPTVIALPDGRVYINSTGNAGMATAGSGDVLTGVIAGLLAQGLHTPDAARVGVYIHGLAGDLARLQKGEMGMISGDILDLLPQALMATERM